MIDICIKILAHGMGIDIPSYATCGSAGLDLRAAIEQPMTIQRNEIVKIPCGFCIDIPEGYEGQIRTRSGLSFNYGVIVLNAPGTIDSDYRGEVMIIMTNLGEDNFIVERNMRVAQLIISKFEKANLSIVKDLSQTLRGDGGFGSTGTK